MTATTSRPRRLITAAATIAGVASAALLATAAPSMAASAAKVHPGTYKTWRAAQHAAGFTLLKPGSTGGLKRDGGVRVLAPCGVPNNYAVVIAHYGSQSASHPGKQYTLFQGGECYNIGEARTLGHPKVDGVKATLLGVCDLDGAPSCHSKHLWLYVTWTKHDRFYQVESYDRSRSQVIAFARGLRKV